VPNDLDMYEIYQDNVVYSFTVFGMFLENVIAPAASSIGAMNGTWNEEIGLYTQDLSGGGRASSGALTATRNDNVINFNVAGGNGTSGLNNAGSGYQAAYLPIDMDGVTQVIVSSSFRANPTSIQPENNRSIGGLFIMAENDDHTISGGFYRGEILARNNNGFQVIRTAPGTTHGQRGASNLISPLDWTDGRTLDFELQFNVQPNGNRGFWYSVTDGNAAPVTNAQNSVLTNNAPAANTDNRVYVGIMANWLEAQFTDLRIVVTRNGVEEVVFDVGEGDSNGSGETPPENEIVSGTLVRQGSANQSAFDVTLVHDLSSLGLTNVYFDMVAYREVLGTNTQRWSSIFLELGDENGDRTDLGLGFAFRVANSGGDIDQFHFGGVNGSASNSTANTGVINRSNFLAGGNKPSISPQIFNQVGGLLNNPQNENDPNEFTLNARVEGPEIIATLHINGETIPALEITAPVPVGTTIHSAHAWSHNAVGHGSLFLDHWAIYAGEADDTLWPSISIDGIEPSGHTFAPLAYDYTASNISPLTITIENTGQLSIPSLNITLADGSNSAFNISENNIGFLSIGDEVTFTLAPNTGLLPGTHSDILRITGQYIDHTFDISVEVSEPAGLQGVWNNTATYGVDFRNRTGIAQPANSLVSNWAGVTTFGDFDFMLVGNTSNNNAGWFMPNGYGRLLSARDNAGAAKILTGPFKIDVAMASDSNAAGNTALVRGTLTPVGGGNNLVFELDLSDTGQIETTRYFEYLGEGSYTLSLYVHRNGSNNLHRTRLFGVEIFHGELTGPRITVDGVEEGAFTFASLPYDYMEDEIIPLNATIVNLGDVVLDNLNLTSNNGLFTVTPSNITNLGVDQTVAFSVSPRLYPRLAVGTHTDIIRIQGSGVIYPITVSVTILPEPLGISTSNQFPNVPNELIAWDNNFQRVILTPDSPHLRINGELRDVDTNLLSPFILNDVMMVPLTAANRALPSVNMQVTGNIVTATFGGSTFTGEAIILRGVPFVPLQTIATTLGYGTVGFDNINNLAADASGVLVVTTGINVSGASVVYNGINIQSEAWYGSPNSLNIAANLLMMQRFDGGWPRGIGQGDAGQGWGNQNLAQPNDINGAWASRNALDAYFGRGITTNETRFMLRMYEATRIERYLEAGLRGLDAILSAQIQTGAAAGGWPYYITRREDHRGGASFSDSSMIRIMELLEDINADHFPNAVNPIRSAASQTAFDMGLDAILNLQIPSNAFADGITRPTGWSLHHHSTSVVNTVANDGGLPRIDGEPMQAREFEPPHISGRESVWMLDYLMTIDNPSERIINAIHSGVNFFAYTEIWGYSHISISTTAGSDRILQRDDTAGPIWARFICMETFNTLFTDRRTPQTNAAQNVYNDPFSLWATSPISPYGRGGRPRATYRAVDGTLNMQGIGTFDLSASYENLSFERRNGFQYIGSFAASLRNNYEEWLMRNNLTSPFVAVSNITDVPEVMAVGEELILSATVLPSNATNNNIVWTIVDAGTTGATISENVLEATNVGTITIRATIYNGSEASQAFERDFVILVMDHISVSSITGVPHFLPIGSFNFFRASALPQNATNSDIIWSVTDAGTTDATFIGNRLTTTRGGIAMLQARVIDGNNINEDFVQSFSVRIDPDPTGTPTLPQNALISNWLVHNYITNTVATGPGNSNWMYMTDFGMDSRLYGDLASSYLFNTTHIPIELEGVDWIRTAQNSRNQGTDHMSQMVFTTNEDMFVYVAFEMRAIMETIHWIDDSWEFMGTDMYMRNAEMREELDRFTNDINEGFAKYYFFRKFFEEGEVVRIGGINQGVAVSNLSVMLVPYVPVELPVDRIALDESIAAAEALNYTDFTLETWTDMQYALVAAIAVRDNEYATQEEIEEATTALNEAVKALVKVEITTPPVTRPPVHHPSYDDSDDDLDDDTTVSQAPSTSTGAQEDLVINTPLVQVYFPEDMQDLEATLEITHSEDPHTFFNVDINISTDEENIYSLAYTVVISLAEFGILDAGINYHRIVAMLEDGTMIGGRFNPETELFVFEATITGSFTISYIEDLKRLTLTLDSYEIVDLAENTSTQAMDVLPIIYEDRVLVPLRFIAYSLDVDIDWNPQTGEVTLTRDDTALTFRPGAPVEGMDVPAQIVQGRTMVPTRFIAEFFDSVVTWDEYTRSVEIIR